MLGIIASSYVVTSGGTIEGADNFADAGPIPITYGPVTYSKNLGNMASYTTEVGETLHGDTNFARSAWWTFIPTQNGSVIIDTIGGTADARVSVYTGSAIGSLTEVAYNDDSGGSSQAKLAMNVTSGTTYRIQYATYPSGTANPGILRFTWMFPPTNDNFANAKVATIATSGGTYTDGYIDNSTATSETGEPTTAKTKSVWYKYTPASSGSATFDTIGTFANGANTDTVIAIYTGATLTGLTLVGSDDDSGGSSGGASGTSKKTLSVTGGTTYWLQVGTFGNNMVYKVNITGPAT